LTGVAESAPKRRTPLVLGIALLLAVLALRLWDPGPLQDARLSVFDAYQRLTPRPYAPVPVRVIDIDDASLAELGQWPWPRSLLARLVERLAGLGAAAIAFDLVLAEPDRTSPRQYLRQFPADLVDPDVVQALLRLPDQDQLLAVAIADAPVVLGFAGTSRPQARAPRPIAGLAFAGSDPTGAVDGLAGAIPNLAPFEQVAAGQGSFALGSGAGGVVRRIPLVQAIGGTLYPTLATEALRVAQGASTLILRSSDASGSVRLGAPVTLESMRIGAVTVPTTGDGHLWVHYTRPTPERSIPATRVLAAKEADLRPAIEGSILLVGTSAEGLKDLRATPLSPFEAGVAIHAQAIEQMLLGWYLARPDWADGAEILVTLALGLILLLTLSRSGPSVSATIGVVATAAVVATSWYAFAAHRWLLDPLFPSLAAIAVYLIAASYGWLRVEREKRQVREAFRTYLAPALVDRLVASPQALRLGGEAREMTFLFTDIAGFTAFTERSRPEDLVRLLNDYLDCMCGLVMEHGGTIDKIVGDAIHAIFNAPLDQSDHPRRAVRCALALDRMACDFSERHWDGDLRFGDTRIGVNTGTAIVGNFGGRRRFDYTAHGDAINTAARLESVNKHLGTRVCVAGATVRRCPDLHFRPVGVLLLKGKTQGVDAFTPLCAEDAEGELALAYGRLYRQLSEGDEGAAETLADLLTRFPGDPLVRLHAGRLARGERGVEIVLAEK
jgi:adenylate cyclase